MALIAEYGGLNSNSYIDVTQANSFIKTATFRFDAWSSLSGSQKQAALIMATRVIDSFTYSGHRFNTDQLLEFPREFKSLYPWNRTNSSTLSQDVVQRRMRQDVQQATAIQAAKIAEDRGFDPNACRIAAGITGWSEAVGPIRESVQYGKSNRAASNRSRLDPDAFALLQEWMTSRRIYRS